jgi:hypothetical protein
LYLGLDEKVQNVAIAVIFRSGTGYLPREAHMRLSIKKKNGSIRFERAEKN